MVIAAVVLVRALCLKPTPARDVKLNFPLNDRAKEYGSQLAQMVQKETISSRENNDRTKFYEFHEILENLFPLVHKTCEKHVFDGSLLYKWSGSGKAEPILLMSHQDVVEANGTWEHAPFGGEIDAEGNLWGRGTVDTKASLYCIFRAVEELLAEGYVPKGDIYIASSCTEELSGSGAPTTVKWLQDHGVKLAMVIDEGGMILDEPIGGVKGSYAMVGVLEKGYGDLKFIARSNGGHASAPGKNTPLVRLGKFMAEVDRKDPFVSKFSPTVLEMFHRFTPNMAFGMKVIFANLWLFAPLLKKLMPSISSAGAAMLHTTLAFTTAKGADGLNVLPQEAYVTANLRFIPHQNAEESVAVIRSAAEKYQLETEVLRADSACEVVDHRGEAFRQVEETIQEIYPGVGVCPYVMTAGTDARFYSAICDNCIRFAPLYINKQQYGSVHGLNENINIGTLPGGVDFYKRIVRRQ